MSVDVSVGVSLNAGQLPAGAAAFVVAAGAATLLLHKYKLVKAAKQSKKQRQHACADCVSEPGMLPPPEDEDNVPLPRFLMTPEITAAGLQPGHRVKNRSKKPALTPTDLRALDLAYETLAKMTVPSQSHFRVVAVMLVEGPHGLYYIVGVNTEVGQLHSAICAERAALVQLGRKHWKAIKGLYIVTDSPDPVTCGTLCREYLTERMSRDTRVVMDATNSTLILTLADMWPAPYLYANVDRDDLDAASREMQKRIAATQPELEALLGPEGMKLYRAAKGRADDDGRLHLHPLQFAAAVLFNDGSMITAPQSKALEYGATMCAVSKMLYPLQEKEREGVSGMLLLHAEKSGVLHAPWAQARALLSEHGFHKLTCVFHDETGKPVQKTLHDLVPWTPKIEEVL